MKLKVSIINQSKHPLPEYQTLGSAGMDLRANLNESISIAPLERRLIPTGLFMALPEGYEAQIRPRSGLSIKQGLTVINTPGTIDSDYRGEIMIPIINLSETQQTISNGDRIAQMIIAQYEQIEWTLTAELDNTQRGAGGFGHSGTN